MTVEHSDKQPGDIILIDYRNNDGALLNNSQLEEKRPLKLVQWNIERNYKLELIIQKLKDLDADILCIQEVDIGVTRSGGVNGFEEIAMALKMAGAFVVEFIELEHPCRAANDQGGNGLHGNAIFSKYSLKDAYAIIHKHQPVNWEVEGQSMKEPRKGQRVTLRANVETPSANILCYSVHMEVFCGMLDRLCVLGELFQDSRAHVDTSPYQIMFGDMNTVGSGFARFSSKYCLDSTRWSTFGVTEAEFWMDRILRDTKESIVEFLEQKVSTEDLERIQQKSSSLASALRNPQFLEPFSLHDITVINHNGYFKGKLDWALVRQLKPVAWKMDDIEFKASDHRLLYVECVLSETEEDWKAEILNVDKSRRKLSLYDRLSLIQW